MNAFIAWSWSAQTASPSRPAPTTGRARSGRSGSLTSSACTNGWQEIIARTDLRDEVGRTSYLKTECRRVKQAQ